MTSRKLRPVARTAISISVRPGLAARLGRPRQAIAAMALAACQDDGGLGSRRLAQAAIVDAALDPEDMAMPVAHEDFALAIGSQELFDQVFDDSGLRRSRQPQAADLQPGIFVLGNAHCRGDRAPHRQVERRDLSEILAEIQDDPETGRVRRKLAAALRQPSQVAGQGIGRFELGRGDIDQPHDVRHRHGPPSPFAAVLRVAEVVVQVAGDGVGPGGVTLPGEDRRLVHRQPARHVLLYGEAADDHTDPGIAEDRRRGHVVEAGNLEFVDPLLAGQQRADRELGVGRSRPPLRAGAPDDVPKDVGRRLGRQDGGARPQDAGDMDKAARHCRNLAETVDCAGDVHAARGNRLDIGPGNAARADSRRPAAGAPAPTCPCPDRRW